MKYLFALLTLGMLSLNATSLPPPYNHVAILLPFNDFGWYGHKDFFEELIPAQQIRTVIEVGSFMGLSTRHIASCLPEGGVIYAIDHWEGSEEHKNGWAPPPVPLSLLYTSFLSNVIHAKLTDKIIPIKTDSLTAARTLNITADLIYIDGAHDTTSVFNDLTAWYPHLNPGGILSGDDWGYTTVRTAVFEFLNNHPELELHIVDALYYFLPNTNPSK